jgi:methylated-DNA-protein-cysteine methyltransferase related protein
MNEVSFHDAVVAVVSALRPGEVVSYGEVALRAGFPGAHRAAGSVLGSTPGLPWWRVVRSDGRLAAGDPRLQAELLQREGVLVVAGRIADPGLRRGLAPDPAGTPVP